MTEGAADIGFAVLVAGALVAVIAGVRAMRRPERADAAFGPVEIAQIVDNGIVRQSAAGASGLILVIFSVISVIKYFAAQTTDQQIVALLLWIGNCVFWGTFMLGAMISSGRTSTVYREAAPAERREPSGL